MPRIAENCQELTRIDENFRELPRISRNCQWLPDYRKILPIIAINWERVAGYLRIHRFLAKWNGVSYEHDLILKFSNHNVESDLENKREDVWSKASSEI